MGASFETGNRGVSALAASAIKNIIEIRSDTDMFLLIGNKIPKIQNITISGQQIQIKLINYRLSPKAKIQEHLFWIFLLAILQRILPKPISEIIVHSNRWLRTLREAHFVGNIHGGDSFSDIYGLRRFIVETIPDIIALLMKKKLILLPQTYGHYKYYISKVIASFIMKRAYRILSRDIESVEIVKHLMKGKHNVNKVQFCPDVAFTLDTIKTLEPSIEPPIRFDNGISLIGFNINGLMYNGGYTRNNTFNLTLDYRNFVHDLTVNILKKTNSHILLIPHTFGPTGNINSDPDACRDVLKSLPASFKNRISIVTKEYDQSEIKGIIGLCDF
ncbi:MAG: polysaccharide pyruvyl transferase family protein, partial [Nanoarchaeota archaeon]